MSLIKVLKSKVARASRKQKLARFFSLYRGEMSILDVGVACEKKGGAPTRNYFLKNFSFDSKYYTGLGVQDLDGMERLFPGKRFVRYPGGHFPFSDQEFGWVFSNAVIEHVGGPAEQLEFINEMLRVCSTCLPSAYPQMRFCSALEPADFVDRMTTHVGFTFATPAVSRMFASSPVFTCKTIPPRISVQSLLF